MLTGVSASAGIGIGTVMLIKEDKIVVSRRVVADLDKEKEKFLDAVEQFCQDVDEAAELVGRNIGSEEAGIISVQGSIVRDPELTREVFELIDSKSVSAEYAFDVVCEHYIQLFDALEDKLLSARSADFRDIKIRLLRIMMGLKAAQDLEIPDNSILVAEDIPPSRATILDQAKISAIVTQTGTRFSHIAIIARALKIPTVVAVEDVLDHLQDGERVIVDGERGRVLRNPTPEKLVHYANRREVHRKNYEELLEFRNKKTRTADGKRIALYANLALCKELCTIAERNVDGIGLFRTEFLYMNGDSLPGEEAQFKSYRRIVQSMAGLPVVIRTLDIGGDKQIPYLPMPHEENPFLGQRGIRFSLARPDILRTQLTALLRASAYGSLKVMFPMISSISELRKVKQILEEVREGLRARNIAFDEDMDVGMMIETPSAAMCSDLLAREVDFFSIGTNDLTQYTLAVDRCGEANDLYTPLHPAVLRLIRLTIDNATRAGIPVEVCGELSPEMELVPLLMGMGAFGFSVAPDTVLKVRRLLARTEYRFWKRHVDSVLALGTPDEVKEYVRTHLDLG